MFTVKELKKFSAQDIRDTAYTALANHDFEQLGQIAKLVELTQPQEPLLIKTLFAVACVLTVQRNHKPIARRVLGYISGLPFCVNPDGLAQRAAVILTEIGNPQSFGRKQGLNTLSKLKN